MILIVGGNSFLAKEFLAASKGLSLTCIRHTEIDKLDTFNEVECIVNFSFAPTLYSSAYDLSLDIDSKLGAFAADHGIHYVMISSRKVYHQDAQWNAQEDSLATGLDVYGKNKLHIEKRLIKTLGTNLTILRPGNILGYEIQPGRNRFGAYLLNQLAKDGTVHLTVAPSVRRDVIPVDFFCDVLHAVVIKKPSGIMNVGAGESVEVGAVALRMIEGFGGGQLVIDHPEVHDEFQLDSSRLKNELGLTCGQEQVTLFAKSLGARLRGEMESHAV